VRCFGAASRKPSFGQRPEARRDLFDDKGASGSLALIGIDDWARKRGHCYGTVVCDLERREIVDRSLTAKPPPSKRGWRLSHHRDRLARPWGRLRSSGCPPNPGSGAGRRPLDLMENASRAFLDVVRRSMARSAGRSARAPSTRSC
jgi:hypothetical protein